MVAINSCALAVIRYGARLTKWPKDEFKTIVRKTRKIMTMHRALHTDIDTLSLPRSQGGRGMISVEDCVEMEVKSLEEYVIASNERLLKVVEVRRTDILNFMEENIAFTTQFSKKTKEITLF